MKSRTDIIAQIRKFNRFYTVFSGFLNQDYLDSGYSVTETRLLFELNQRESCSAKQLIDQLKLDKGYVSRIIRSFEEKGLIVRQPVAQDRRRLMIALTSFGKKETERLIEITNQSIKERIELLSDEDLKRIAAAMETIMECFEISAEEKGPENGN